MSGLLKVGTGTGMLLMPIMASWLISSFGWRTSYVIIGVMVLVLVTAAGQFLSRDPRQKGLLPYGADEASTLDVQTVVDVVVQDGTAAGLRATSAWEYLPRDSGAWG